MKKFFLAHPDVILATVAIILLVVLIGFFSWGINDVVFEIEHASVSVGNQAQSGFDIQAAASLDFRGISTSTTSTAGAGGDTANATSSASVTTSTPSSSSIIK